VRRRRRRERQSLRVFRAMGRRCRVRRRYNGCLASQRMVFRVYLRVTPGLLGSIIIWGILLRCIVVQVSKCRKGHPADMGMRKINAKPQMRLALKLVPSI